MATKAYRALEARNAELTIENWNLKYPPGTKVRYYMTIDDAGNVQGDAFETETRSEAWSLGGQPCVMVNGKSGGRALTHIQVIGNEGGQS